MEYLLQILQDNSEIFITQGKKLKGAEKYSSLALDLQKQMMDISCMYNLLSEDHVGTRMWLEFEFSEDWENGARNVFTTWANSLRSARRSMAHIVQKLLECFDNFIQYGRKMKEKQEGNSVSHMELQRKMMDIAYMYDILSDDHIGTIIREKFYDVMDWETVVRSVMKHWLDTLSLSEQSS